MDLIVRQKGEARKLRVERDGDGWQVTVDDNTYRVDRTPTGAATSSLLIDGAQHEISVHRLGSIDMGGERYGVAGRSLSEEVEVIDPLAHLAQESLAASGGAGRDRVSAYMPGRVVTLLVEEGAEVAAGQGILVLEAMKMENEIVAERAGVLKSLFVELGQPVEGGDPLFEIE